MRQLAPGEVYHIYNRGTEKRTVFTSRAEHDRFIALLYLSNNTESIRISDLPRGSTSGNGEVFSISRTDTIVEIGAYCLMPNHFHLLIREKEVGGISKFMQKLTTGYTMYFNTKHERSGALFQGKFKASHVGNDRYLKYLLSYIHLNPVALIDPQWKETGISDKRAAEKHLTTYKYSSYLDYLSTPRPEGSLLNKECLPDYFDTPRAIDAHITDWLNYQSN